MLQPLTNFAHSTLSSSNIIQNLFLYLTAYHYGGQFFFLAQQSPVGQDLIIEVSRSYSDIPHSVGLLWTSDRPEAKTSTWQDTSLTRDRNAFPQRDSNSQSQQASGRRPTQTARPLESKYNNNQANEVTECCILRKAAYFTLSVLSFLLPPSFNLQRRWVCLKTILAVYW